MSKTMTPTVWLRLLLRERANKLGRYPSLFAAVSIFFFVLGGMYRASGALFRTMETVVEENPLDLATSRIVAVEPLFFARVTISGHRPRLFCASTD